MITSIAPAFINQEPEIGDKEILKFKESFKRLFPKFATKKALWKLS